LPPNDKDGLPLMSQVIKARNKYSPINNTLKAMLLIEINQDACIANGQKTEIVIIVTNVPTEACKKRT